MKILIFLFLIISTALHGQQSKNLVIIVLDGSRYSETFGDTTHQYIPHIWNDLKPHGTIYTSFYNNGTTLTNSGHSTIETGTWQSILNNGSERPHVPTFFEYYRKQTGATQSNNYVILGKDKLDMLAYSDHSDYGISYSASVQTSSMQYEDINALANFKVVTSKHKPKLLLMNLPQTDNRGHSGVWTNYLSSIRQADSIIWESWLHLQADTFYKDKTTFIVVNDHGRHLDGVSTGFKDHGDSCEGCRHIMCFIAGPDTRVNHIDDSLRQQVDIAPTVGHLLGFSTPFAVGKVISSAVYYTLQKK